ncbi:hypothetical protein [Sphingomonas solaris]|uniref:Uncharacterized protein n=1 Tax=Alterirhizorhabdus solaris TaxID=2529389 RepID=A0A558R875_9SPHN|nr:hypothetical protein [Sphingomonas solaris]TVV75577.1 hypothetical protein FOY91_06870 [Sphingomonas solaris]
MSVQPCGIAGCANPAPAGLPMCRACWGHTPPRLRNALNRSWRNEAEGGRVHRAALDAAARWHAANPTPARKPRRSPRTARAVAQLAAQMGGVG